MIDYLIIGNGIAGVCFAELALQAINLFLFSIMARNLLLELLGVYIIPLS